MADRWIVSRYHYVQHKTLEIAQGEKARLSEKYGVEFRIYRLKTTIDPTDSAKVITELRAEIDALKAQIEQAIEKQERKSA
jgi:hypothetical protein